MATESLRPGERFPDRELEIVWAAIETLTFPEKAVLLRDLATTVAGAARQKGRNSGDTFRRAIASLWDAYEILGHPPTVSEYKALRLALGEIELMSDRGACRALGGGTWNDALQAAYLPPVPGGDFVHSGANADFTLDEVQRAVQECVEERGGKIPTQAEFLGWARRDDVRVRPGRRPLSHKTLLRFGGYRNVVRSAGYDEQRLSSTGRVISREFAYNEDELREWLRNVAKELGYTPRVADYVEHRNEKLRLFAVGAADVVPPVTSTYTSRWGDWSRALAEAGLPPVDPSRRPRRHVSRPTYAADELVGWLKRAWVAVGEPFTSKAYNRWRQTQLKAAYERGEYLFIPTSLTIARNLGGWVAAQECVRPSDR
jgi:hypothetical protein